MISSEVDRIAASRVLVASLVLVVLAAGCAGSEAPEPVTVSERDSAGIVVLEAHADTARLRTGWSIGPEPLLTIGGIDAAESQQLFQVSGGVRLTDGRIVVANGGSSDIRVFGADGAWIATFGRKGEGPGEFTNPRLAGTVGEDSLLVFDSQLRRLSIMDVDTGYVRSVQVGSETGGFPVARGALAGGNVLLGGGMFFSSDQGFPTGLVRPPSHYMVVSPEGGMVGDFGDIPAAEMFARTDGNNFRASSIPFGKVTAIAAASARVWLGTGESWELRAYSPEARLERIVRIDRPLRSVTPALVEAHVEEEVADVRDENQAREIRSTLAETPVPSEVPPYQLFSTDALDYVWIGEYLLPGEFSRTWTILDPDGRPAGRLTLPPRTVPLDIGPDWLLAVTVDELDVESLTLWRLERPSR